MTSSRKETAQVSPSADGSSLADQSAPRPALQHRLLGLGRRGGIAIGLLLLIAVLSILSPIFLTIENLSNVALQSAINTLLAIGMTFVIVTSGIDLSVGSILAVSAVVGADLMTAKGVPIPIAIGVAVLIGAILGGLNGLLIVRGRIAPFIATLGTLSVYRGLALLYTDGRPVYGVPAEFRGAMTGSILGIPTPVILALLVAFVAHAVLRDTRLGEHSLAIGGNEEAARLSGVNVDLSRVSVYVISGTLAALAAMVLVARLGAAEPISGQGYELNAIAAAVMGGASLAGGRGSIVGTVLGALIIASLQAGLTLLNVPAFYQLTAIGAVIILAVLADRSAAPHA